jgi:hypothetical protein
MPTGPATTIVSHPNPYQPGYDTLSELFADSSLIVLGSIGPETSEALGPEGGSRAIPGGYPIPDSTVQFLVGTYRGSTIGIPTALFNSLSLKVGGSYVFFFTQDPSTPLCVVGGLRGVFRYNPATQTVNRVDHNSHSQIPPTMTLSQLEAQLNTLESQASANAAAHQGSPILGNPPPYCSPSATGL